MKKSLFLFTAILGLSFFSQSLLAADDPSIQGSLRAGIQQSMNNFIDYQTEDGQLYMYDNVDGKLLKLKLVELHSGIVKKGNFYVSCADFQDQSGRKIDVDFMVRVIDNALTTTQALVHSVDGKKRAYHLEK